MVRIGKTPPADFPKGKPIIEIGIAGVGILCLKLDGHLWITEPTSRIQDIALFRDLLFKLGFDVSRIDQKWKFTFIKAIKTERDLNQAGLDSLIPS